MSKKTWLGISIIFLGVLFVIIKIVLLQDNGNNKITTNMNANINITDNSIVAEDSKIEWNEITANGINEELLLENLDTKILEKIASNFQSVIEEEQIEEQENPDIVIKEGWTRIFDKEKYKEVIAIGKPAMKPLYYILYKSKDNGQYEYLCAYALQEISQITFKDEASGTIGWSKAQEYLNLFTKEILKQNNYNESEYDNKMKTITSMHVIINDKIDSKKMRLLRVLLICYQKNLI